MRWEIDLKDRQNILAGIPEMLRSLQDFGKSPNYQNGRIAMTASIGENEICEKIVIDITIGKAKMKKAAIELIIVGVILFTAFVTRLTIDTFYKDKYEEKERLLLKQEAKRDRQIQKEMLRNSQGGKNENNMSNMQQR